MSWLPNLTCHHKSFASIGLIPASVTRYAILDEFLQFPQTSRKHPQGLTPSICLDAGLHHYLGALRKSIRALSLLKQLRSHFLNFVLAFKSYRN